MSVNITFLVITGVLLAAGFYLVLERTLTRVLLGIMLLGNGVNLLILTSGGRRGVAPLFDSSIAPEEYSDPLPQALILTAIVITFAVTAFLLAMIYRSWALTSADVVADDTEDIKVSQSTAYDEEEDSPVAEDTTEFVDEEGRPIREGEE
ncbi:Na(+)/H(+) antiporter subunit C [Arthrobacter sp. MYb211]|uniref:Na(+)/H(+) antiporter subunit C n=1 Tax=Micrococcaceae TaxID=1268 RepID=UPI000BB89A22|nr:MULTISPECIES: Na(+)/H(+) antiporter subunit C [Micrococcaceae]PCC30058.1 Na(+)/H(+) antiporter subunit C [Glutamicibacter sp. BW80]PQZ99625.1 Na(+)/H(+) antiporter subunit C [Arthrobacter sp. MYb224]PRA05908.1 Na(+)/H(+) antiporter subunit C [Arthrobacter sp. MYb229]PRA11318.1 Na(+)/H(+) antiporter subunit C [Arthrobacter sp. MYb221]PRB52809.1 Na(+)/H(+) antiporter subunit C [Arthrobacter sp. MYb216]